MHTIAATRSASSGPSDWVFYVVLIVLTLIALCLLMNTVANLIERISPDLRTLQPAQTWLSVIPVFGSFWVFFVVQKTAGMLQEEYARRKIVEFETSPGLATGWGFCFLLLCAQLTLMIDATVMTTLLYIGAAVMFAVYWQKLNRFRQKLDHDLMQHTQPHMPPFPQQPHVPFQQPPNYFPPPQHFPPPPSSTPPPPPNDWERWKPK